MANQRLELTWIGKNEQPQVEPRILLHDPSKDYGDPNATNMLIHGDNLLALKALEQQFAGQVKCIYIDPPYNTGSAFEQYDDNLEHSIWLNLMMPRLEILNSLLSNDGVIFIQIDDTEFSYLKLLCDEVFSRENFVTSICIKMSHLSGVKMSHIEKTVPKLKEFLLVYCKKKQLLHLNPLFEQDDWFSVFDRYKSFAVKDKDNPDDYTKWSVLPLRQVALEHGIDVNDLKAYETFCIDHASCIFRTARNRSLESMNLPNDNKFRMITSAKGLKKLIYKGEDVLFCSEKCKMIGEKLVPVRSIGDIWLDIGINNLHNEGGINFRNGKKPEKLIKRVIEMTTKPNDLVLDSFLGSGTTAAVAHKMGRRWIGIEFGEHCYTHCKSRLDMVISGNDSNGITKEVNWQGGGGYKFYELAPTLIVKDKYGNPVFSDKYNPTMLAAAVAKINGFVYAPNKEIYWKQGYSQDNSFIYVTTQYLDSKMLDSIAEDIDPFENLLVCAPAFDNGLSKRYNNINVRKIPQSVLKKCEFGVDNYDLNIVNPPEISEDEWEDDEEC